MSLTITCPNCAAQFEPSEAMEQSFKTEYNKKWAEQKKKQDEEFRKKEDLLVQQRQTLEQARQQQEEELSKRLAQAMSQKAADLQKDLTLKITADLEAKMKFLEEGNRQREEQLKDARTREVEYLKKQEILAKQAEEMELEKQRMINEERSRIAAELHQQNEERNKQIQTDFQLKQKEWEVRFEQQKKLLEEAQRKAQQNSMQLQGEVQEMILEDLLKTSFPFDIVSEVGKGVRGADCILKVRNSIGVVCGSIIFESKRTKDFGTDWIDKLKNDCLSVGADIAVIVTQAMPKDMERFGEKGGVYICNYAEAKNLVGVLRQAIMKVFEARKSQENKGDKMVMLYDYLTGSEFMSQWNAMRDTFRKFKEVLQKERDDFEKNWKKKEKMLEMIVNNSMQISGSIEGISGQHNMNWNTLPEENKGLLD